MTRRTHSSFLQNTSSIHVSERDSCNPKENFSESLGMFFLSWIFTFLFGYLLYKIHVKTEKYSISKKVIINAIFWLMPLVMAILIWDDSLTKIMWFWIWGFIAGFLWYLLGSYILSFFLKPTYNHYLTLGIIILVILWLIEDILRACRFEIPWVYTGFIFFMLIFPYLRVATDRRHMLQYLLKNLKIKLIKFWFVQFSLWKISEFRNLSLNIQQRITLNITLSILISILSFVLTEWEFNDYDGTWFVWFLNFWIIGFVSYKLWSDKK